MRLALLSVCSIALSLPACAPAESAPLSAVHAVRLSSPVTVDGVLSESVWENEHAVTRFTQRDPIEGAPPSQRTEVRVAYDDEAIYVGARLYDTAPESIYVRLSRRDVGVSADAFAVFLDPYHDRRSGYYFMVNAAGTLYDGTLFNDNWDDSSWDGVWHGSARVDPHGWTAEMRIPYSQLRFPKAEQHVWGVNFRRSIPRHSEEAFLVYQPKNGTGFVSLFPELVGIENIRPGGSIEIRPYFTTKAEYLRHEPLDPFHDGSRYVPDGGADLRMALGSRLTLNATVNPDFGQVEVDPAVVNLSDVESFFDEKRPFFVEGSSHFRFGNEGASDYWGFNWPEPLFFYSRRIGRNPQGSLPDGADHADMPVGTSILGATKLTGKLAPGWNLGTLHALTARERAEIDAAGARSKIDVEPLTYYGAVRTLKEMKDRRNGLGFKTTFVSRSFDDGRLRDELNSQSLMTGLDGWTFLDRNQTWVVSGWSALTHVRGTSARISDVQRNSLHYFQRPDAEHVEVDPDARSLTGFGSRYWLNKQKGRSFFNAAAGFLSPAFDMNDIGFMSYADVINWHVGGGYKWTETTRLKKYQDVIGAVFASYDFGGHRTWGGIWGGGFTEFANNYSWQYRAAYNPRSLSSRRSRGGPLTVTLPGYEISTYFDTDGKQPLFYFFEFSRYSSESGSWNWFLGPGVEWKPAANIAVRVSPQISRVHEDAQYVDTLDDPLATATFGRRYVFGTLDQTEVSAGIRLNWAFTPNLSLQTYLQPLISSGDYTDFKSLARPRSYSFETYAYPDNPDFSYVSLRGNTVLRWEYSPGSTLFVVWTQERSDSEETGEFRFGPSSRRLLDTATDNIFLAKVTYYLTR